MATKEKKNQWIEMHSMLENKENTHGEIQSIYIYVCENKTLSGFTKEKLLGEVSVIVNYNEINVNTVHCSTRVYAGGGCCF